MGHFIEASNRHTRYKWPNCEPTEISICRQIIIRVCHSRPTSVGPPELKRESWLGLERMTAQTKSQHDEAKTSRARATEIFAEGNVFQHSAPFVDSSVKNESMQRR